VKVIVGLGNPGRRYARTRHNIGFMALDTLASRLGKPRLRKKTRHFIREDYDTINGELVLIKPLMYMNLSGEALLRTGLNWDALAPETLVLFDDTSLPFGRIRIRPSGSAGGHKGMKNIIDVFQTPDIARVRLGVGSDPERDMADYVLAMFTREEVRSLAPFLDRAADAVQAVIDEGVESAMNNFNAVPEPGE